ncbi:hypothetical protein OIU74_028427 [Salix koriyanagi]|uniref:Secreted protein n=1 Tax=Salix koriyanagi TaxID=2511006 RepID=A0A9Q0ZT01_9ROSI|nr:hypothetical protein OIU74_028427 [Salix koriyanagi]
MQKQSSPPTARSFMRLLMLCLSMKRSQGVRSRLCLPKLILSSHNSSCSSRKLHHTAVHSPLPVPPSTPNPAASAAAAAANAAATAAAKAKGIAPVGS